MIGRSIKAVKYVSFMLIVIGISIIFGFMYRRHSDRQTQLKVMAAYEDRIAAQGETETLSHDYLGATMNGDYMYLDGETLAIMSLDRLGIKVSVAQGTEKDTLRISAGHFENTGLPGEGNFCIAGHSSMIYTCLFNKLHEAVIGDMITVTSTNGRHRYMVSEIEVVEPTDVQYLNDTDESVITIITCTNSGAERLMIRGEEI